MQPPSRWLPFEKPLQELEEYVQELERLTATRGIDKSAEIARLKARRDKLCEQIFSQLSPWDKVLMARHPSRPYTMDYIRLMFEDFAELHGDRRFGDDPAIVAGLAWLDGRQVAVVGHQKGRDLKERQFRNFGSARPEGYRKALRVMQLAEKFGRPVVCFVDTPAAESRLEAEERGICEAIARNLAEMSVLRVPIAVVVIGEGGSGGAIGIGVGDWVMMLEHSTYSVIPPEGCAAILDAFGRDASRGPEAAQALRLSAQDALEFGIADEVIDEPLGGAHRDPGGTAARIKHSVVRVFQQFGTMDPEELIRRRYEKFRGIGVFTEPTPQDDEVGPPATEGSDTA
ncbi:MAG: acetyl-CoA carboxylase carboxyltransferase subunit alpha [Armatimonadota bacterium]|nr:MAG: acetyl-CoA carboxylase carboxyltransferase subunit alpha [Armatimonadota bacterium]